MASRDQIAARKQDIDRRIQASAQIISEAEGIEYPPAYPWAHQPEYRANDEMERVAIFLERLVAARYTGEQSNGSGNVSDGKRSDRRRKAGITE